MLRRRDRCGVPGVCDDNVVEWGLTAAEAGEANLDNHLYVSK
jgi:hypothetical protein